MTWIREQKFWVRDHWLEMKNMDSKQSVHKLGETIHSLLGLKAHLTSSWVKSVCDIVKNLPSTDIKGKKLETQCSEIKEIDSGPTISGIKGWRFALGRACCFHCFHKSLPHSDINPLFVSLLTDELATLSACINQLNIQRRQILNEFLDSKG